MVAGKDVNQRVAWLKAVQGVERNTGKLLAQLEDLKMLTVEGLEKIENERTAAQATLDSDIVKIDSDRKRKLLDLELDLERTQRTGAVKIMESFGEEPIMTTKRVALEARIHQLETCTEDAVKSAEATVRKYMGMQHSMELERTKLNFEKDQASLTERNKALVDQVAQKDIILNDYRENAVKMQNLVQGVAEASNKGGHMYMPPPK
jgi:hypothetical protein